MRKHARFLATALVAALALVTAGCGGGGGGGDDGPERATLQGSIDRLAAPRTAAAARVPADLALTAVAVDETGAEHTPAALAAGQTAFTLAPPVDHDYVVEFRVTRGGAPVTVAVLVVEPAAGRRAFRLAPGAGTINLGTIDIDLLTGRATSSTALSGLLPAVAAGSLILVDTDGDGIPDGSAGDVADQDDDGVPDLEDAFAFDPAETVDTDGDGIGNNADTDDDGDGVADVDDAFPLEVAVSADTDGDGLPDDFNANATQAQRDAFLAGGGEIDLDDDADGVADALDAFPLEVAVSVDTDGDGLPDDFDPNATQAQRDAFLAGGGVIDLDDDGDGLSDAAEVIAGTNPLVADTDGDGIQDGFEVANGLNPLVDDATLDNDTDGLNNLAEFQAGSNPNVADTDGDGLLDGAEVLTHGTSPLLQDTDGDTLTDPVELAQGTSPVLADTDSDGVADNLDLFPLDPTESADNDLDGIGNNADLDDDNDGLSDVAEAAAGTDPFDPDTDNDGVVDGADDVPLNNTQFAAYGAPLTLGRLAGAQFSSASALNGAGIVAGVSDNTAGVVNAVIWNVSTGIGPFNPTPLGGGDGTYGAAFDVNESDLVVGEASVAGVITATLWPVTSGTPGPAVTLGSLAAGMQSSAYALDDVNGIAIGEAKDATGALRAVAWKVDPLTGALTLGPVELPLPAGATASAAYQITDLGQVVGEFTDAAGLVRGGLWTVTFDGAAFQTSGPTMLPPPGGGAASSVAYGVNEPGQAVGLAVAVDGTAQAVAWNTSGINPVTVNLATTGIESNAWTVGARGRVVGWSGDGAAAWHLGFTNPATTAPVVSAAFSPFSQAHAIGPAGAVAGLFDNTTAGGRQAFVVPRN